MIGGLTAVRACRLAVMVALGLTVFGTPICATAAGNVVVKQIGSAPLIAHGVRAVTIDLGAADDWITLEDFHANFGDVPWDLRINTGSGNDTIDASDSGAASLQNRTSQNLR